MACGLRAGDANEGARRGAGASITRRQACFHPFLFIPSMDATFQVIYIYIYMCVCVYIYIYKISLSLSLLYIYIYIYTQYYQICIIIPS